MKGYNNVNKSKLPDWKGNMQQSMNSMQRRKITSLGFFVAGLGSLIAIGATLLGDPVRAVHSAPYLAFAVIFWLLTSIILSWSVTRRPVIAYIIMALYVLSIMLLVIGRTMFPSKDLQFVMQVVLFAMMMGATFSLSGILWKT